MTILHIKTWKHYRTNEGSQMQRYIVESDVSITDSKIKPPRRPAGNVSNWHHLFFLTPLIYSQHWQCESKVKEHSAASALYCMHNAKIKKGAGSKADITTHAYMLPDDVSLPHQREPQLLQKGTRGQNKRRPPRFINSQSINMQSVAR